MDNLQIFNYGEIPVRTVLLDGEPWWVLADVCRVLELSNPSKVAARLDGDEKQPFKFDPNSELGLGHNGATIINESGLYKVILRSDKPEAKKFTRWVTHEVLPAIRKTGAYGMTTPPPTGQRALTVDDYLTAISCARLWATGKDFTTDRKECPPPHDKCKPEAGNQRT